MIEFLYLGIFNILPRWWPWAIYFSCVIKVFISRSTQAFAIGCLLTVVMITNNSYDCFLKYCEDSFGNELENIYCRLKKNKWKKRFSNQNILDSCFTPGQKMNHISSTLQCHSEGTIENINQKMLPHKSDYYMHIFPGLQNIQPLIIQHLS